MSFFDYKVMNDKNKEVPLADFKGKTVLAVNVASKCGFTPQYDGLEKIYQQYKDQGFVVIGFPCNQFGAQEQGSNAEIQDFCRMNFGVSFPVMAKIDVNGDNAHPVYEFLKSSAPGILGSEGIKWNFTKFLIDGNGNVLERYAPTTKPEDLTKDIEKALASK